MKHRLLSIIVALCTMNSFQSIAQWNTVGTNHIYSTNSGNVGINTGSATNPPSRLSVYGSTTIPVTDIGITSFSTAPNAKSALWFRHHSSSQDAQIMYHLNGRLSFNLDYNAGNLENNEYLTILHNGNIGINTATPSTLLHLYGTTANNTFMQVQTAHASAIGGLTFTNDTGTSPFSIYSYPSGFTSGSYNRANGASLHTTSQAGGAGGISLAARHASGILTFHTGGETERMRIGATGLVGININDPSAMLDVAGTRGSTNNRNFRVTYVTNNALTGMELSGITHLQSELGIGWTALYANKGTGVSAGYAGVFNGKTLVMNGELGIGTTNPMNRLSVVSDDNSDVGIITNHSDRQSFLWFRNATRGEDSKIIHHPNGRLSFNIDYNATNVDANEYMTILPNGNIGIGVVNPDQKLTVNGAIHTKEVRVDVQSPLDVGDYVFENDYKLMPLNEVETYVKEEKHLPEVPSAREFVENGMNLKEMNLLLLKKVEELTLHIIEQNKRIEALESDKKNGLKKEITK